MWRPEVIEQHTSQFGLDAILKTLLSPQNGEASIDFVSTNRSGKELLRSNYAEARKAATALCPAMTMAAGWPFYFGRIDGVAMPKATEMKAPVTKGISRLSGVVILSAVVTTDGRIEEPRVIQGLRSDAD